MSVINFFYDMRERTFDWHKSVLTPDTEITENYKNTQNVRRFFKKHIGTHFHFTIDFMLWMKTNTGKTLQDAMEEWKRQNKE